MDAIFFIFMLKLRHEKNIEYTERYNDYTKAYIFDDRTQFEGYFINNGYEDISNEVLESCCMLTTKKGSVVALKALCDYTIDKHKSLSDKPKQYSLIK